MDDQKIVALFLERSEQALAEAERKYGKLCRHIARGIVPSESDAEECTSEAFLALWNTIPPEQPTSLRSYVTKLLRNIAYDRRDKLNAEMRDSRLTVSLQELEAVLPDATPDLLEHLVLRDAFNAFLRSLNKMDRFLFLRRYYYLDTCRDISRMVGMTESAVSTRLGRLRRRLKELLQKEGVFV